MNQWTVMGGIVAVMVGVYVWLCFDVPSLPPSRRGSQGSEGPAVTSGRPTIDLNADLEATNA